jgi:coproporphyrinogen III oxidase-like Fe-S oxidoreductase
VSAHELWGGRRRANISLLPRYVEELAAGRRPVAMDAAVSREEETRERLVLGLRLAEGVAAMDVEDFIRACSDRTLAEDYASWREARLLEEASGSLRFTERGFLVSNEILCRFV